VVLHVFGGEIARPIPLRGQADDGNDPRLRQNAANSRDIVDSSHGQDGTGPGGNNPAMQTSVGQDLAIIGGIPDSRLV